MRVDNSAPPDVPTGRKAEHNLPARQGSSISRHQQGAAMSVAWSRRRDDEPDHPDQERKVTGLRFKPDGRVILTLAPDAVRRVPFAAPDTLESDVIEPTAVFNPEQW